jgi:hypothetical protein
MAYFRGIICLFRQKGPEPEAECMILGTGNLCKKHDSGVLKMFRNIWPRGRAIAQAVSRWFPTATARVRARVSHVGFVVDRVALGLVFSEFFGFQ